MSEREELWSESGYWASPRDQIAEHTGIGAGTVSSIISNHKAGLHDLEKVEFLVI